MGFFEKLGLKTTVSGSAFGKIAEAETKKTEAEGRIIAIDATNKVKNETAAFLEKEVTRVHAETDALNSRLNSILDRL